MTLAEAMCGRPRWFHVNGLSLRLHEWGSEGAPAVLLLHSLAAHGQPHRR